MSRKSNNIKAFMKHIAYAALLVLSQLFFTKDSGMLRMIPLAVIMPAVATVFYNNRKLTVSICVLLSLFFNMMNEQTILAAVTLSILAGVFAFVGIFVKRLFVTSMLREGTKRAVYTVCAVILAAISLVSYAALFGNVFSAAAAKEVHIDYINYMYGLDSGIACESTFYDFGSKSYVTEVSFEDGARRKALISYQRSMKPEEALDGVRDYYEEKLLDELRGQIFEATEGIESEIDSVCFDGNVIISSRWQANELAEYSVFEVRFKSQTEDLEDFVRKCEEFVSRLDSAGIVFGRIVFYGGYAENDLFRMELDFGTHEDYKNLVEILF